MHAITLLLLYYYYLWSAALIRYCVYETRFRAKHYNIYALLFMNTIQTRSTDVFRWIFVRIILLLCTQHNDDIHNSKCLYLFRPSINRIRSARLSAENCNRLFSFGHYIVVKYSNIVIVL